MKNINYIPLVITLLLIIPIRSAGQSDSRKINTLTKQEINEGWKLLWDGKTTEGWRGANSTLFPETGWTIKDGILSTASPGDQVKRGGDIITKKKFGNFELVVDFMYEKGANSGIKYFVDAESDNGKLSSIGCEYQIIDDKNHPDAKAGLDGNHTLAALYDLIAPRNKVDKGLENWNRARILVNGNHVEHWLNGQKTVEYERATTDWRRLVSGSKYKPYKGFGESKDGHILLQDHGDKVSFRNIKIREFD
jgi:hypothetical protein